MNDTVSNPSPSAGYYSGHLLVAMPRMDDPNFSHSVTYLCEHSDEGALGIVVNRPMELKLGDMLDQFELAAEDQPTSDTNVYLGGPVQPERGFVLHSIGPDYEATLHVAEDMHLTSSRDILDAIADGSGPGDYLVALGYAGWGAGQLDTEILDNAWLVVPANRAILFETPPEQRWEAAVKAIGIDPGHLSAEAGHC